MRSYHEQVQNINTQFYTGTIITNAIRQTDRQTDGERKAHTHKMYSMHTCCKLFLY